MTRKATLLLIAALLVIPLFAFILMFRDTQADDSDSTSIVTFFTSLVLTGYYVSQS
jgi:hypothetical protein